MMTAVALVFMLLGQPMERPCYEPWRAAYRVRADVAPVVEMIRCAARRAHLSPARALEIAECESHFRPDAYYKGNAGVFQHDLTYWRQRLRDYAPWLRSQSPYNAYTNVIVAMEYASVNGWAAWECA